MTTDTSARPHELLNLRIKDVEFIEEGGHRYATIVLNGKTGQRTVPLIDSIPYVAQWISLHPQQGNRDAVLFPGRRGTGKAIIVERMRQTYNYYKEYFISLLSSPDVPDDDKKKIRYLLRKRWNPYVHRHSAITEKSGILSSDAMLGQYPGWTPNSTMNRRYQHFSGGESMNDLLRAKGIVICEQKQQNILEPKICPSCRTSIPNAMFCFKCNFVLSFEAYHKAVEEKERKDQELQALRNEILETREHMVKVEESQLKITVFLEVMKIPKSSDGKVGKNRTMLDEKRRVTIGYVDDNNQRVEMKVPLGGFEMDEAGVG